MPSFRRKRDRDAVTTTDVDLVDVDVDVDDRSDGDGDGNGGNDDSTEKVVPIEVTYERQLQEFATTGQRRDPVPSAREIRRGLAPEDYEYRPPVAVPKPPRKSFRERNREAFRNMNPKGIAEDGRTRYALLTLMLASTVAFWDDIVINNLIVFMKLDLGFDFQFMVTMTSLIGIIGIMFAPIMGYFLDRVKRVRVVQIGAMISNLSSVLVGLAPTASMLVGARIIGSIGPAIQGSTTSGAPSAAQSSLLADYIPVSRRARAIGLIQAGQFVGGTIAVVAFILPITLLGWFGWRAAVIMSGIVASASSLLLFGLREPVRGKVDREEMGVTGAAAAAEQKPVPWAEAWRSCASIGTLRRLWYAAPFTTAGQTAMGAFVFFVIQERVAKAGAGGLGPGSFLVGNPKFLPLMLSVPTLLSFFGTMYAVPIADRLIRQRPGRIMVLAGLGQLGVVVGMLAYVVSPLFVLAIVIFWFVSLGQALVGVAQGLLLSVVIPARIRSQGMTTIAPWNLAGLLLVPILGGFADLWGAVAASLATIPIWGIGAFIFMTGGATVAGDIRAALASSLAEEESRAAKKRGRNKLVICRDVDVSYGGTRVLFNVDFDVEEGELVALLGTNGAGKSTLLRAIAGIQEASNGAIFLDGSDITHKPAHLNARDGIVFLPGGRAIFPTLTVEDNLRTAAWLHREEKGYLADRLPDIFAMFPVLHERLHEKAGNMSGGEQQMLALAQAFLMQPRLLMIDELSLGLAPAIVEQLLRTVRRIHAEGATVIVVEQSVNVALTLAERAVFLDRGQKWFDGPTPDLLKRPDLVRSVFLGGIGAPMVRRAAPAIGRHEPESALEPVLAATDIRVAFGGITALDHASLSVKAGEIVGIIGPNGAGKTTLFDVFTGFVTPDEGTITVAGTDVTDLPADARARLGLGRSFQNTRLFPSLTARENITVALERHLKSRSALLAAMWAPPVRRSERRARRRVDYLIDLLSLERFANKFVGELSTGSRRMVELACIMAAEPSVLLFDEPSSGLAQAETEVLGPTIQRLAREAGAGIVVIEHDMPLITSMSDRLVAMEHGRVLLEGEPTAVVGDARVIASYLGRDDAAINRSGQGLLDRTLASLQHDSLDMAEVTDAGRPTSTQGAQQ